MSCPKNRQKKRKTNKIGVDFQQTANGRSWPPFYRGLPPIIIIEETSIMYKCHAQKSQTFRHFFFTPGFLAPVLQGPPPHHYNRRNKHYVILHIPMPFDAAVCHFFFTIRHEKIEK